uniref:Uncharacterized protein n=1 Tax=Anguilla anguilla TaxID=7936 RepID=A0A0E9UUT6_ANGAN
MAQVSSAVFFYFFSALRTTLLREFNSNSV